MHKFYVNAKIDHTPTRARSPESSYGPKNAAMMERTKSPRIEEREDHTYVVREQRGLRANHQMITNRTCVTKNS